MAGVNKIILLGNIGADPEIKTFDSGKKVAKFNLATTESYKNQQGERVENTEWHSVKFWGPVCDVIEKYLKKGNQVYVEGKMTYEKYQDKEGKDRYFPVVNGENLTLLGGNRPVANGNEQPYSGTVEGNMATSSSQQSDDLPF